MTSKERSAFLYAAIVAMGGFIFGLDAALISGTVGYITREFSLTDVQLGMAVSAPGFGVLVALPIAGVMANRLGRKRALQVIAALYLVSAGWSAFAPSFVHLVAARFLGGLAFTSIAMAAMYIGEIAPPRWRGKLVSMTQINIVIGLSGAYFINYLIQQASQSDARWVEVLGLSQYTWRWMLGSEILPALLWFALLAIIPESPYWLVYANRLDAARATLRRILPAEQIERHISEMLESMRLSHQESVHTFGTQLREIFSARMRVIFIIAITLAIAQQSTGINAIMFYATTVIEQLGIGTDAAFMQAIWFGITSVVFTVIGLLLVDRLGRRPLILWGMAWIVLSLGVCSYGFKVAEYELTEEAVAELTEVPNAERLAALVGRVFESDIAFKAALREALGEEAARDHAGVLLQKAARMPAGLIFGGILSFIAAFHFSVGPVMWVLFSEIFPIGVRGVAIPLFTLITSFTSWLVQQFFPLQLSTMGASSIFLFYAATVAVGLVILWRYLVETKNQSIEEIQLTLMAKSEKARS